MKIINKSILALAVLAGSTSAVQAIETASVHFVEVTPAMINRNTPRNNITRRNFDISSRLGLTYGSVKITMSSVDVRRTPSGHTTFTLAGGQDNKSNWSIRYSDNENRIKVSHGGTVGGRGSDIFVSNDGMKYTFGTSLTSGLRYANYGSTYYVSNNTNRKIRNGGGFIWRANEDDFTFNFQVNTTANSGYGKGSDYKIYVDISKNI